MCYFFLFFSINLYVIVFTLFGTFFEHFSFIYFLPLMSPVIVLLIDKCSLWITQFLLTYLLVIFSYYTFQLFKRKYMC